MAYLSKPDRIAMKNAIEILMRKVDFRNMNQEERDVVNFGYKTVLKIEKEEREFNKMIAKKIMERRKENPNYARGTKAQNKNKKQS